MNCAPAKGDTQQLTRSDLIPVAVLGPSGICRREEAEAVTRRWGGRGAGVATARLLLVHRLKRWSPSSTSWQHSSY